MRSTQVALLALVLVAAGCASAGDPGQAGGDVGGGDDLGGWPDAGGFDQPTGCPLADGPPAREVIFTRARPGGDPAMEARIVQLIDGAVPGASIRLAIQRLDRVVVSEALIAAAERGVDVRVVVDERNQVESPIWSASSGLGVLGVQPLVPRRATGPRPMA
jgi:phosphatidylserine/phosphatidylglycerophosphate/cardiolipin synthase-like enzyme